MALGPKHGPRPVKNGPRPEAWPTARRVWYAAHGPVCMGLALGPGNAARKTQNAYLAWPSARSVALGPMRETVPLVLAMRAHGKLLIKGR